MRKFDVIFVCFTLILASTEITLDLRDTTQSGFSRRTVFKPKAYHGRSKREILSTKIYENNGQHLDDITVVLEIEGRQHHVDLLLNRELISEGYFEKYQEDGAHVVRTPGPEEMELCHYQGKLRNIPDSWAAISTCQGLRGTVYDGKELRYLTPATQSLLIHGVDHHLYSHSDMAENSNDGHEKSEDHLQILDSIMRNNRGKRSTDVQGPYQSNEQSRYVELVLVADQSELRAHRSQQNVITRFKDIVNIVNSLYKPLNIFIALVGVVMWTEQDKIPVSTPSDALLDDFLKYRSQSLIKSHPNDNAFLITNKKFEGNIVGKAMVGGMCSMNYSGGVVYDPSREAGLVAVTLAHEIGHSFNMSHDTFGCRCAGGQCIMAESSPSLTSRPNWSSCSVSALRYWLENGLDTCLHNKPKKLYGSAVCGNGWLEAGEECDSDNSCCDRRSCRLTRYATCATGSCCNLKTCQLKKGGTVCREKKSECDLSEYCTGKSEFCPREVFLINGSPCKKGNAHCYEGSCRSHQEQCQSLWGRDVTNAKQACYDNNQRTDLYGNCGKTFPQKTYKKCQNEDLICGRLQCDVDKTKKPNIEIMQAGFFEYQTGYNIIQCRTIEVDNQVDPGLVPNGASCGKGKMCVDQKCVAISSMPKSRECANNCSNNGVCNNKGHCHCNVGFSPPDCKSPGRGGSLDSGPVAEPSAIQKPNWSRPQMSSNFPGTRRYFYFG